MKQSGLARIHLLETNRFFLHTSTFSSLFVAVRVCRQTKKYIMLLGKRSSADRDADENEQSWSLNFEDASQLRKVFEAAGAG